ncbi:MAG: D-alanyl-D-alanine carboxypeptidase/D-alanyl-D-alanine-endopeptidase [Chitinispirillales bacterium]|jgi:D-alanyl-D-alanine carboxypeptidase/D-alanyl-D-alanine-endopeptidase (penicillin-binding protein 4)|nr:D-alanyl-D-alanine carboxypeptidase/D-alanyl-D-alanine-endopeptidase [Chitinispirillales bacterium]
MRLRRVFAQTTAALLFLHSAGFASMQASVDELVRSRNYDTGGLGVVVMDMANDSVVVSINAGVMMNPASVQKLVTGAAAFEILGPTHMHVTRVFIDGEMNADSGVVHGNLYIRGGGDPGLNAEKIWTLVQHLQHRGIRRVRGDLMIDNFFFDEVGMGPGFSDDGSRSYQSLISALPPNFSSVGVHHRPGQEIGSPIHTDLFPQMDGVRINSTATTVEGSKGRLDVTTSLTGGTTQVTITGTMGIEEQPGYTYRRMWQTWEAFGSAFRAQAAAGGLVIDGRTVQRRVPDTLAARGAFYTFGGEPLTVFMNHMFKWSSNFVSEMLFKTMGAFGQGQPGTWPKGTAVVTDWWTAAGLPGTPHVINGSGMGSARRPRVRANDTAAAENSVVRTENLMSAAQAVALLAHVSKQKSYFPDFLSALPSSGVDGTLRTRFRRSNLRGVVRAKTGTLNSLRVSALAGYLLLDDRTYAFAIFCNNVGPNQYDNWIMQEQILDIVARTGWGER